MTNKRTENATGSVCSVDRCSNPSFAYCMNDTFSGKICEECFGRNSPLWDRDREQQMDNWHKALEEKR